jgi:hypothetical protein
MRGGEDAGAALAGEATGDLELEHCLIIIVVSVYITPYV